MKRLIIVGSPRVEGRSGALADLLFESCIEECPEDEVYLAPVSTLDVAGCNACDFCKRKAQGAMTEQEAADDQAFEEQRAEDEAPRRCAIRDDMDDVYPLLEDADELIVVAPVYFAGPSSQLKCMLDRFQPYFWTRTRARKRPCTLHVVGEGGDPHGFDPLVGCVRSAAAVAGFRLERVLDWVGKIDESGEIVDEAGRRIDAAQHGRKRSAQKKHANAKRGTNGTVQAKHENPHAPKGKGGQGKSGKGGSKQGGGRGKQGKRRG